MKNKVFLKWSLIVLAVVLLAYVMLVLLVCYWEVHNPQPQDYDSIIVLGCQVNPTGEPSVQLQRRLDKAIEYYQKKPCKIVVTGGQGEDEPCTEAYVMRECLLQAGIPDEDILCENESRNTKANIVNAWALLLKYACQKPLIVTSDYHVHRALAIARDNGIIAEGAGSLCRNELRYWLKNHCREALSWVKYWLVKYLKLNL